MTIIMYAALLGGVALIVYAFMGLFSSSDAQKREGERITPSSPIGPDFYKEMAKRGEAQIAALKKELDEARNAYGASKDKPVSAGDEEGKLKEELQRKEEWLKKSEEMLDKAKAENTELKQKFDLREKESQEEFAKNVNLSKQLQEAGAKIQEQAGILKEQGEQIEIQKHQIEKYMQEISEQKDAINVFHKKEKESEWIPKEEFNKLNEEYTEMEKELEASEEKLRSLVEELVALKAKLITGVNSNDLEAPSAEVAVSSQEPVKEGPVISAQETAPVELPPAQGDIEPKTENNLEEKKEEDK